VSARGKLLERMSPSDQEGAKSSKGALTWVTVPSLERKKLSDRPCVR